MGSIVHRSVPTNLKWFPNCSHAHALFQDRFKDVQVGSRWFSTLYILSPNFHTGLAWANTSSSLRLRVSPRKASCSDYGEGGMQLNWFWPVSARVKVGSVSEMLE